MTTLNRSTIRATHPTLGGTVAVALAGALLIAPCAPFASAVASAQTVAKPAMTPKALTPQQQRAKYVVFRLDWFLRKRISSPTGKMTLVIRPGARADLGYFNEVVIAGAPLQIKKLRISNFALRARNVRLDPGALTRADNREIRTLSSRTSARAIISEDDLTWMFAQGSGSKSMGLRAKFIGNQIRVTGNWNWGWFNGPVTVLGGLRLVKSAGGNQVFCDISSLKLNGAEVPAFMRNKFSEKLNPLISYDQLPFSPNIRTLTFQGSKAIITT
jgi:hypothetical protein